MSFLSQDSAPSLPILLLVVRKVGSENARCQGPSIEVQHQEHAIRQALRSLGLLVDVIYFG